MSFSRHCWITFDDETSFQNAETQMTGLIINEEPLNVTPSISKNKRVKVLKKYPKSRLQSDANTVIKLIETLDKEADVINNPLLEMDYPTIRKKFDLGLLYLRRVHSYEFFSGNSFDSERQLALRMGLSFLRIEADYEELPNFPTVFKRSQEAAEKRAQGITNKVNYSLQIREEVENMACETEKITQEEMESVDRVRKCHHCVKKFKSS